MMGAGTWDSGLWLWAVGCDWLTGWPCLVREREKERGREAVEQWKGGESLLKNNSYCESTTVTIKITPLPTLRDVGYYYWDTDSMLICKSRRMEEMNGKVERELGGGSRYLYLLLYYRVWIPDRTESGTGSGEVVSGFKKEEGG